MKDLEKPMTFKAMGFQDFADTFPLYKHASETSMDVAERCVYRCGVDMLREKEMRAGQKQCMQQCYVKFFDALLTLKYQLEYRSESMANIM